MVIVIIVIVFKDLPITTFSSLRDKFQQPEQESPKNRSSHIDISCCLFWYTVAQPLTVMGGAMSQDNMPLTGGRSQCHSVEVHSSFL